MGCGGSNKRANEVHTERAKWGAVIEGADLMKRGVSALHSKSGSV